MAIFDVNDLVLACMIHFNSIMLLWMVQFHNNMATYGLFLSIPFISSSITVHNLKNEHQLQWPQETTYYWALSSLPL